MHAAKLMHVSTQENPLLGSVNFPINNIKSYHWQIGFNL